MDAWALSIDISFLAPAYFIVLKIAKKSKNKKKYIKIEMVYRMSGIPFRVCCIHPKERQYHWR